MKTATMDEWDIAVSRPEQLLENCKALENVEFSEDELKQIDEALAPIDLPESL